MDFLPKWEINPALPQGKMKISFRLYYFFLRPGNPLPQELSPRGKGTALATPRFKVSPLCCSLWTSDGDRNSLHAFWWCLLFFNPACAYCVEERKNIFFPVTPSLKRTLFRPCKKTSVHIDGRISRRSYLNCSISIGSIFFSCSLSKVNKGHRSCACKRHNFLPTQRAGKFLTLEDHIRQSELCSCFLLFTFFFINIYFFCKRFLTSSTYTEDWNDFEE